MSLYINFINGRCHIKQLKVGKSCKTCLTNHTQSILHHITPLVINALGDTHTHIYTNVQTKAISRNQACDPHAPGLKSQSTICRNNSANSLLFLAYIHKTVNTPDSSQCLSYVMEFVHKLSILSHHMVTLLLHAC